MTESAKRNVKQPEKIEPRNSTVEIPPLMLPPREIAGKGIVRLGSGIITAELPLQS